MNDEYSVNPLLDDDDDEEHDDEENVTFTTKRRTKNIEKEADEEIGLPSIDDIVLPKKEISTSLPYLDREEKHKPFKSKSKTSENKKKGRKTDVDIAADEDEEVEDNSQTAYIDDAEDEFLAELHGTKSTNDDPWDESEDNDEDALLDELAPSEDDDDEDEMMGFDLDEVLAKAIDEGASDVDVVANDEVSFEILGDMKRMTEYGVIKPEITTRLQLSIISHVLEADFVNALELDTAYVLRTGRHKGRRTRLSVGKSFGEIFLVFRVISDVIPTPDSIGVPKNVQQWCERLDGLVMICGPTGSGKALRLDTRLLTPSGETTMEKIQVGDQLLDSHNNPTTVTAISDIDKNPDLYRVTLSDGQEIYADGEHEWIVSDHKSRNDPRRAKTIKSRDRKNKGTEDAQKILELSNNFADKELSSAQIYDLLNKHSLASSFVDKEAIQRILRPLNVSYQNGMYNTKYFNGQEALTVISAKLFTRFEYENKNTLKVLNTKEMLEIGLFDRERANFAIPVVQNDMIVGGDHKENLIVPPYLLGAWLGDGSNNDGRITAGLNDYKEMHSIITSEWGKSVEVRLNATSATIVCGRPNKNGCLRNHDYLSSDKRCKKCDVMTTGNKQQIVNGSLSELLGRLHVKNNKHIPASYLRASFNDRLSLLQGIMDTDGTANKNKRGMSIGLSNKKLAYDVLELVNSLGIKARMTRRSTAYRDNNGTKVQCKDSHQINFTTTLPVFRLDRKILRVPEKVKESHKWIYIKSIEKVSQNDKEYGAVKCVTVDSPDSSYLCENYIVTHNSTTFASMIRKLQLEQPKKIITVEKPIEYIYGNDGLAVIVQREVGKDSRSFAGSLKSAMRQHPKIIMIGEVRDQEEVDEVLRSSETGHLALTTMHATSPPVAINRIMSLYEGEDRLRILSSLKSNLRGIANQTLVKTIDGKGRFSLFSTLEINHEVSSMIGEGNVEGLEQYMRDNELTMEHQLAKAFNEKRCTLEDARNAATNVELFDSLID